MNDEMIDLVAGDERLRRRLEAYAEYRLSPDLTTTSRMRARVLAHAHRQADRARADAALTIVPPTGLERHASGARRTLRRPIVSVVAAAALAGSLVGGVAAASAAGGALYDARLWVEEVTLPADPSQRALAELERLARRLSEADAATRTGDLLAAAAALTAYERIMTEASADVLAANDPVAAAAFETGLGRNVEVLQALIAQVPSRAGEAISRAVERAIARSTNAIERVDAVRKPAPAATGGGGSNGSSGGGAAATPKPAKEPNERPAATPKPVREPSVGPAPTPKPAKTPRPGGNPGQGGPPPGNAPD